MKKLLLLLGSTGVCMQACSAIVACSIKIGYGGQAKHETEDNTTYLSIDEIKKETSIVEKLENIEAVGNVLDGIEIEGVDHFKPSLAPDSNTDVNVDIFLEENYALPEYIPSSFLIKEAIADDNEEHNVIMIDFMKIQNFITTKIGDKTFSDIESLQKYVSQLSFHGISNLKIVADNNSETDVVLTFDVITGYSIDGDKTFVIKNIISTTPVEPNKILIKIEDIQNDNSIKAIVDLSDLEAVNEKLSKINITGVASLSASMVEDSSTDVKVTISIADGYELVGEASFVIKNAIKQISQVMSSDIQNDSSIKAIVDLSDLEAVNEKLSKINITGVASLSAIMVEDSSTDVKVTISIADGYELVGETSFVIKNAIKQIVIIAIEDIKKLTETIVDLADLDEVNAELLKLETPEYVIKLTAKLLTDSLTDVVVTIEFDAEHAKLDSDDNTFNITGAIKEAE